MARRNLQRTAWSAAPRFMTLLAVSLAFASCDSHVGPSEVPRDTPPDSLYTFSWKFDYASSRTTVELWGQWGGNSLYGVLRDVSAEATWESTAPGVFTIAGPGQLQSVSPGEAQLKMTFRGRTATRIIREFAAGEPPLYVYAPNVASGSVTGVVGGGSGANVQIVDGPEAGRTAVTDSTGRFRFSTPFTCGQFTFRVTKAGFQELVQKAVICESQSPSFGLQPIG